MIMHSNVCNCREYEENECVCSSMYVFIYFEFFALSLSLMYRMTLELIMYMFIYSLGRNSRNNIFLLWSSTMWMIINMCIYLFGLGMKTWNSSFEEEKNEDDYKKQCTWWKLISLLKWSWSHWYSIWNRCLWSTNEW